MWIRVDIKKQSWTETADQAKKNWQEYNKMPVQDYDSGPDYGSKNKELLEELDKKLSTARTKLKKLMNAAEEKGRAVIGYCSDYKAGMDAGRKIAEAEYHNWELTLLFAKMRIGGMTIFGIPTCRKFMTRQEMHPIIKTHFAQDLRPVKQCLR